MITTPTIKFRFWDGKKMCYTLDGFSPDVEILTDVWEWFKNMDFTVMQFTGFYDINGKEIYNGDIVTYYDFRGVYCTKQSKYDGVIGGWIGTIKWADHSGWRLDKVSARNTSLLKRKGKEFEPRCNPYIYEMERINNVKPEVIGNIFENPELLTQE